MDSKQPDAFEIALLVVCIQYVPFHCKVLTLCTFICPLYMDIQNRSQKLIFETVIPRTVLYYETNFYIECRTIYDKYL